MSVRITRRGGKAGRGFHQYGKSVTCSYGSVVDVYESSAAAGPHVWLNVVVNPEILRAQPSGEGTAHLNKRQAEAVIARLQAWVDEIPARWRKS